MYSSVVPSSPATATCSSTSPGTSSVVVSNVPSLDFTLGGFSTVLWRDFTEGVLSNVFCLDLTSFWKKKPMYRKQRQAYRRRRRLWWPINRLLRDNRDDGVWRRRLLPLHFLRRVNSFTEGLILLFSVCHVPPSYPRRK